MITIKTIKTVSEFLGYIENCVSEKQIHFDMLYRPDGTPARTGLYNFKVMNVNCSGYEADCELQIETLSTRFNPPVAKHVVKLSHIVHMVPHKNSKSFETDLENRAWINLEQNNA